uniref:Uncharacterized protein n=1 Tax=Setaria italica TaxID=4555 RepID=K4AHU1_SETIT
MLQICSCLQANPILIRIPFASRFWSKSTGFKWRCKQWLVSDHSDEYGSRQEHEQARPHQT